MCRFQWRNLIDRGQYHSQITNSFQQAMQGRLISHGSGKKRIPALFQRDSQAFEPVRPLRRQVACNPDFVVSWGRFLVHFYCRDGRQYTGKEVLPGSNLSIVWSIVLRD